MKIAISGATGQLGQQVIQALLKEIKPEQIVALVRNPEKAQHLKHLGITIRHFDYDQIESLAPALQGIDKLLLISANEIGRRVPQHRAVIEAAQTAAVPYIAYTSLYNADHSPLGLAEEHRATEQLIKASGLKYSLLRNNWYSENYLANIQQVIAQGILYGCAQTGQISSASRQDYAEAAAKVLMSDGHEQDVYEFAGSQSFTLSELAAYIGAASGQQVIYQDLAAKDYHAALIQAGLPIGLVDVIVDADVQAVHGAMYSTATDLAQLLGRASTPIQVEIQHLLHA